MGLVVIRFMKIRAVVLSCEFERWKYIPLFGWFLFFRLPDKPICKTSIPDLLPQRCSSLCHSVNRCVMHDGWHFYMAKYGYQCSTLVISSDAGLQNRKSQIPPTTTGYLTQKHYNFELSIITIALAPLTCLWPTKDARMAFSFLLDHDQSLMVLSLVFKTKVQGYRKARGEYKAYAYMTSPGCMIREPKSINEVYRSPICIEP